MALKYLNLDARTRAFMLEEIEMDIAAGTLYLSPWLTEVGKRDWPQMMRDATTQGSDATLAGEIVRNGRLSKTAQRRKPKGAPGFVTYTVPPTAPDTMAEGEFNRFYVRALCRRAIEDKIPGLIVYRAKSVAVPRPGSEEKIGTQIDPSAVLADLRESPGVEPALGLPPGPNSGLSAKLP
jgi:hypothetical protein